MTTGSHQPIATTEARAARKGRAFLERLLTCARQRCSYVGCSRLRHTGPCRDEATEARNHGELH